MDLLGLNIMVDMSGASSYQEFKRMHHFVNTMMTNYKKHVEIQKSDLFKVSKETKK